MILGFLPPGVHALYEPLHLSVDETLEYDELVTPLIRLC